jgi:hypothetical protein
MDKVVVEKLKTKFMSNMTKLLNEFWDLFPEDVSDEEIVENLLIAYNSTLGFCPFLIRRKDDSLTGCAKEDLISVINTFYVRKSQEIFSMGIESMNDSGEDSQKSLLTYIVNNNIQNMEKNVQAMKKILDNSSNFRSSKDGTLGMYAWPERRKTDYLPYEKNTEEEELLSSQLYTHFQNTAEKSVSGIDEKGVSILKKMLANGEYPDIIREPKIKTIYRGMAVTDQELRNFGGGEYVMPGTVLKYAGIFIPKKSASSWTRSRAKAISFAKENETTSKTYCIILMARTSDNSGKLLQCDDALYKFDFADGVDDEHEVIALGNITTHSIEILN